MGKVIQEVTTETVDHRTGENTETTTERVINLPQEPAFVKIYLEDISKLYDLPANSSRLLHALLRQMNYDSIITLSAPAKRRIAKDLKISLSTINNQLTALTKTDVLQRIDRGEYMLNPSLFAKGAWNDVRRLRNKYFELKVTYNTETGKREVTSEMRDERDQK